MRTTFRSSFVLVAALAALGCDPTGARDASVSGDAGLDGSLVDSGALGDASTDGGAGDAAPRDAAPRDAALRDAALRDAGSDAGSDAGFDAGSDAGPPRGGCISGASGTHVVRFRWAGTTSGSRAYVRYEANTLPDTSRWRVSAASRSIGYTPVFRDPFLGEGGLDLSGTVFIDVELSTAMLSRVSNATIAIYGRSYNTTTSGSFAWRTFSGTGASPRGGVSNVAPYRWYGANATAALPAGDGGTLLRITAGGPSNALIVNRVEICFDAI